MQAIGGQELGIILLLGVPILAATIFWVWALADCLRHEKGDIRLVWVIVIALTHAVGAILYVFLRRRSRREAPHG
jgi:type VI protein secretion system component VasK